MVNNRYQHLTCKSCQKKRNLVWDPQKELCYDCLIETKVFAQ